MMRRKLIVAGFLLILGIAAYGQKPKVGLVLSGGGAKGFAHIGVLQVLDAHGIHVDYVGGTSMGAAVGAFYAMGYDANTIARIALSENWERVFRDETSRRILAMEEKEMQSQYFLQLPVRNGTIELPGGLVAGQQVAKVLSRYTLPAYVISDFNKLPKPFYCIAADIETGESVVLDSGNLADALRASISIPSVFVPKKIGDRLLVDGGLLNNLPVQEMKARNPCVVIAVDVQTPKYSQQELDNLEKIIQQSAKFLREENNKKSRRLADVLIRPDIKGFDVTSFSSVDTLIGLGKKAAMEHLPQILDVTKQEKGTPRAQSNPLKAMPEKRPISEVKVSGLQEVSEDLVLGRLKIPEGATVSYQDIEAGIERIYGTRYFKVVDYVLDKTGRGNVLHIRLQEKSGPFFNIGLHYDDYFQTGALLNLTFRNLYFEGSKLFLDARLSQNPMLNASYFISRGLKPGLAARFQMNNLKIYEYDENRRVASLRYSEMRMNLATRATLGNDVSLEIGGVYELSSVRAIVSPIEFQKIDNRFLNFYGQLKFDTYDRANFATSGVQLKGDLTMLTYYESYLGQMPFNPQFMATGRYNQMIPVNERLKLEPSAYLALSHGDTIPSLYMAYFGGHAEYYTKRVKPFIGLGYMQVNARHAFALGLDVRYRLFEKQYLSLILNSGVVTNTLENLSQTASILHGIGLGYSIDTFIGPVEFTLGISDYAPRLETYFNIGYWF